LLICDGGVNGELAGGEGGGWGVEGLNEMRTAYAQRFGGDNLARLKTLTISGDCYLFC
jgi:hypothetical protein